MLKVNRGGDLVDLKINKIPRSEKNRFKAMAAREGKTHPQMLIALMDNYERGSVIFR